MSNKQCNETRRQLDELTLDELAANSLDHLATCPDCTEFHAKQTRLRQLVGSLGMVSAPPDFDFKLRARIAQDEANRGFRWFELPALRAGLVSAALLLVVAVLFVGFNRSSRVDIPSVAIREHQPAAPRELNPPFLIDDPSSDSVATLPSTPSVKNQDEKPIKRYSAAQTGKKGLATIEYSSARAPVLGDGAPKDGEVFPIATNGEPFRISVEDKSGNARVITVPTVSFGSQRVMSNQFVSKGSNW
jgi:hypothetical protein